MPKHVQGLDQGRVKVRVIELEVEGANSTLVEGIKNLAAAISRGAVSQPMKSVRSDPRGNGGVALSSLVDTNDDVDPDDYAETVEHEVPPAARKVSAPRKQRPLKPVHGIDWATPIPSLSDFVNGLELDSAMRKYTAIAYWFKEHRNMSAITVDHIYSAYKALGWTDLPKFATDPLKNLKNKREYK